jgi:hypothetical protein
MNSNQNFYNHEAGHQQQTPTRVWEDGVLPLNRQAKYPKARAPNLLLQKGQLLFRSNSLVNAACMLKCNLMNARSICNQLPELYQLLYGENFDIIVVTES